MGFIGNIQRAVSQKVRYKLLLLVLFPILLIMPVALGVAIYWGKNFTYEQLFLKVSTDLAVSHDAFNRIQDDYLNHLTSLAESHQFRTALEAGNSSSVLQQVDNLKNKLKFSFLKVISTENDQQNILTSRRNSSSLLSALKGRESVGVEIYSPEELLVEDQNFINAFNFPFFLLQELSQLIEQKKVEPW